MSSYLAAENIFMFLTTKWNEVSSASGQVLLKAEEDDGGDNDDGDMGSNRNYSFPPLTKEKQ